MKVLVVEDNPKHQRDARAFLKTMSDIEPVYAWSLQSALDNMSGIDGILSDIYMPLMDAQRGEEARHPIGVVVLMIARERDIPCVLVTAGYHHGNKYQPICEFQRSINAPEIVDSSASEAEAETKNWPKGLEVLCGLIERRRSI
jgi:CheY-like chemotaxis protein